MENTKKDARAAANESITLTIEQLRTLIAEARAPAPPTPPTLEEAFETHQRMMHEAKERAHTAWYIAFVSRDTNARGVAYISASRRHASGRVLNLPHYEYPLGCDRTRANGGTCDLGEITNKNGQLTADYKQWRYEFWKTDLRALVGGDAGKLATVGQPRPTLNDALADLNEYRLREQDQQARSAEQPTQPAPVPAIIPREAAP